MATGKQSAGKTFYTAIKSVFTEQRGEVLYKQSIQKSAPGCRREALSRQSEGPGLEQYTQLPDEPHSHFLPPTEQHSQTSKVKTTAAIRAEAEKG